MGDYAKAEQGFRALIKIDPRSAAAYSNLGVVYLRTNRLDSAIKSFEAAHKLAPQSVGISLNLGLAYFRKKDFQQAIPHFDRVLRSDPTDEQARYLKGMCHFVIDDYESTVRTLEPLWTREQNNLDFLFVLGIAYGKLKRTQDSEKTFERVSGELIF